jgi:hypothetical protein
MHASMSPEAPAVLRGCGLRRSNAAALASHGHARLERPHEIRKCADHNGDALLLEGRCSIGSASGTTQKNL